MTYCLEYILCALAAKTSCEAAARIMKLNNVRISLSVGIDDFSLKKRHRYGTIIVDESTHKPVTIQDGRDGEILKEWLKNNKHVTSITRDRASAYSKVIEEVLPDCMQIADRFHLHQNSKGQ